MRQCTVTSDALINFEGLDDEALVTDYFIRSGQSGPRLAVAAPVDHSTIGEVAHSITRPARPVPRGAPQPPTNTATDRPDAAHADADSHLRTDGKNQMTNTDHAPLAEPVSPREIPDAAIAMLDAEGTVVGWTHAAEQLVGYSAGEVVGRSAAHVLPPAEDAPSAATFAEQCRAQDGWSGTVMVRHRDGHAIKMTLRISLLWGQDAGTRWLVSVTDIGTLSSGAPNGAVRESLLARAPIGIAVYDPQLRCTWVSDVMERHVGVPRDRWFGRRLKDLFPGFEAEALESVMRQVLESGPTKVHEYRAWPPADQGRAHLFSASFFCLQDADGKALGVCSMSVDVTGNRRARERLAILSEASTRIGSTLDLMQTGQELADLAVPLLADIAVVDLMGSVPFGLEPSARIGTTSGRRPVLRRAGVAAVDLGVLGLTAVREEVIHVPPTSSFGAALRTGRSHLEAVLDTHGGPWVDHDPTRAQKVRDSGIHSLMVVPIRARRCVLGLAVFGRSEEPTPFQEDDLLLAEELVTRAALSLDNALQYARQRTAALTLQRDLLPHHVGGGAALDVASRYVPADMDHGGGRLVRRDQVVWRPGGPRCRRCGRTRHQRRGDDGPIAYRRPHARGHGTASPRTAGAPR